MLVCGPFFMDRYELVFELIPKVTVPAQKDWIKQPEKERKYPKFLKKQAMIRKEESEAAGKWIKKVVRET